MVYITLPENLLQKMASSGIDSETLELLRQKSMTGATPSDGTGVASRILTPSAVQGKRAASPVEKQKSFTAGKAVSKMLITRYVHVMLSKQLTVVPTIPCYCFLQEKGKEEEEDEEAEVEEDLPPVSAFRLFSYNKPEYPIMVVGSIGAIFFGAVFPAFGVIFSRMLDVSLNLLVLGFALFINVCQGILGILLTAQFTSLP